MQKITMAYRAKEKRNLRSALLIALSAAWMSAISAEPLKVCVSSTDVKSIVEAVGGDAVEVRGFVAGADDPHTIEATRGMIESLASAELLVIVGNGLEEAWLPTMIEQSGNSALAEGSDRVLDL